MIKAIDGRLWEWADWHRRGMGGTTSMLGRLVEEGWAALIRGSGTPTPPAIPIRVEEVDHLVLDLDASDQRFLRVHYFQPTDPVELKARMTRMSVSSYYVRLDRIHHDLQGRMEDDGSRAAQGTY